MFRMKRFNVWWSWAFACLPSLNAVQLQHSLPVRAARAPEPELALAIVIAHFQQTGEIL